MIQLVKETVANCAWGQDTTRDCYCTSFFLSDLISCRLVYTVQCTGSERVAHRRRIELKDKAKVVAPGWGTEFVKFLAALAVLPQSIWKNGMNSTLSFK